MKKLKFLLLAIVSPVMMWAQQGINYQAVVRDGAGAVMANQAVTVDFKIMESIGGLNVYEETHAGNTNDYGLVNLVIGQGSVISGVFEDIDWGADVHFLDITINGSNLGAVEFQAVPYAYFANEMTNVTPNTADADVEVTSDDTYTELFVHPIANANNDSSVIRLGEGSLPGNDMSLTYDGIANELKVGGHLNGNYMGTHLTIQRSSGLSTFTKGVEILETTSTPAPNRSYGNSGPLAYAYISGTVITTDYGVASVTSPGTGVYTVVLDNAWVGSPVVVACSLNNSSDTETVTYNTTGADTITVRIVDESNAPVASNFSLIVYGVAQ